MSGENLSIVYARGPSRWCRRDDKRRSEIVKPKPRHAASTMRQSSKPSRSITLGSPMPRHRREYGSVAYARTGAKEGTRKAPRTASFTLENTFACIRFRVVYERPGAQRADVKESLDRSLSSPCSPHFPLRLTLLYDLAFFVRFAAAGKGDFDLDQSANSIQAERDDRQGLAAGAAEDRLKLSFVQKNGPAPSFVVTCIRSSRFVSSNVRIHKHGPCWSDQHMGTLE